MLRILLARDAGSSNLGDLTDLAGVLVGRGHLVTSAGSLPEIRLKTIQARIQWVVCWAGPEARQVDTLVRAVVELGKGRVRVLVVGREAPPADPPGWTPDRVAFVEAGASAEAIAAALESRSKGPPSPADRRVAKADVRMFRLAAGVEPLVGSCRAMATVVEKVKRVAETSSTVLLLGESGTGKELVARSIHSRSPRADRPLITVNCGAIPFSLLESELFGYERGAFTGAGVAKKGLLAQADGGTVFLDEVGELPLELQVKLLRFLQEGEIAPIGGGGTIQVDVRVVSATNRDLSALVEKRLFREDLYYRLAVIPIRLPPVRERREDIPQLLQYFLERCREKTRTAIQGFSPEAIAALTAYDWPGNVREIRNFVERLAVLSDGPIIDIEHLPESIRRHADRSLVESVTNSVLARGKFADAVADFERSLIARALEETGGNQKRAAERLGVGRTTLIAKARKLGVL